MNLCFVGGHFASVMIYTGQSPYVFHHRMALTMTTAPHNPQCFSYW